MALGGTLALTASKITSIAPEQIGAAGTTSFPTFRVTLVGANGSLVVSGVTQAQISVAQTAMNTQADVTITLT